VFIPLKIALISVLNVAAWKDYRGPDPKTSSSGSKDGSSHDPEATQIQHRKPQTMLNSKLIYK